MSECSDGDGPSWGRLFRRLSLDRRPPPPARAVYARVSVSLTSCRDAGCTGLDPNRDFQISAQAVAREPFTVVHDAIMSAPSLRWSTPTRLEGNPIVADTGPSSPAALLTYTVRTEFQGRVSSVIRSLREPAGTPPFEGAPSLGRSPRAGDRKLTAACSGA